MPTAIVTSLLTFAILLISQAQPTPPLQIRKGSAITLDGKLASGEWDDAQKLAISAGDGWSITARYKHDGTNLLFAFSPVQQGAAGDSNAPMRFPEVLIDTQNKKSAAWQPGQWWFHTSANDCEANGEFNLYRRDGKFLCAKQKPGWDGNNWPFSAPDFAVEITISFEKVGLKPNAQRKVGLAFNLTDTRTLSGLWPASAKLESPATWGEAVIVP